LLNPHERLRELAGILAQGIQRCRTGFPVVPESAAESAKSINNQPKSSRNGLEFLSASRPDGQCQPETTWEE
jgi:hypothetical protein